MSLFVVTVFLYFFFFKQKTAYEMRISDWSSDVCSSDLRSPPSRLPNPGPMSVLRFDNVSKQYPGGHVALSDVSFDVGAGELLFVTGHSGAGQCTLLKLFNLSDLPIPRHVLFAHCNFMQLPCRRLAYPRSGDVAALAA